MADFAKENQFTPDQQAEIDAGIKDNIDVSIYAKPEFLAIQMHEIRIGLVEQIPVSYYADSRYDWFQMEEIRKGLEMSLDVSKYADPNISFDRMRQIRKGLEAGIDLSDKKNMAAGVLQQLRKATLEHIDLSVYINNGFDEDQLHQIRLAKKNGVDIDSYVIPDFRGISIREIRLGLEHHIDVSVYASREYTWQQMREIRLGLEKVLRQLVRQDVALPGIAAGETLPQRRLALALQIAVGGVEIVEARVQKGVHHLFRLRDVHVLAVHRQPHAAEAEVLPDMFHVRSPFSVTRRRAVFDQTIPHPGGSCNAFSAGMLYFPGRYGIISPKTPVHWKGAPRHGTHRTPLPRPRRL